MSVCLSASLFTCLSVNLFVCLPTSLSLCAPAACRSARQCVQGCGVNTVRSARLEGSARLPVQNMSEWFRPGVLTWCTRLDFSGGTVYPASENKVYIASSLVTPGWAEIAVSRHVVRYPTDTVHHQWTLSRHQRVLGHDTVSITTRQPV